MGFSVVKSKDGQFKRLVGYCRQSLAEADAAMLAHLNESSIPVVHRVYGDWTPHSPQAGQYVLRIESYNDDRTAGLVCYSMLGGEVEWSMESQALAERLIQIDVFPFESVQKVESQPEIEHRIGVFVQECKNLFEPLSTKGFAVFSEPYAMPPDLAVMMATEATQATLDVSGTQPTDAQSAHIDSGHYTYGPKKRREIADEYRKARDKGLAGNRDAWAQSNYFITGKTLKAYLDENPPE